MAQGLASAIGAAGLAVTASATGAALTVTSTAAGTAGDGVAVTLSSVSDQPTFFPAASFSGGSGTLTGGVAGCRDDLRLQYPGPRRYNWL